MQVEKAKNFFHGVEKYNCAQAILAAYKNEHNIGEEKIKEYAKFGGGRAEDNTCGAIYALKEIVKDEKKYLDLRAKFVEVAKSYQCKQIKKLQTLSCQECVIEAAKLLIEEE